MRRFRGKTAIITGGSRGIGRAISQLLVSEGAKVVVNYLKNADVAREFVAEIESAGGEAMPIRADVSKFDEVEAMVDEVFRRYGQIDILVNNAGIVRDSLLLMMEEEDWKKVVDVNLGGVFHCTKAVAKYMILKKSGTIINMSSVAASMGGRGHANYASSKGGIDAFTRSMAIELAPKGIRVIGVAPGVIMTEMSQRVRSLAHKEILGQIPLRRMGTPEDVAKVVLFLASEDAGYITGETIAVTGGMGVGV